MSKNSVVIEKTMSLTWAEFERSLAKLDIGLMARSADAPAQFLFAGGTVTISFKPLPSETFGGLLTLPRARVLLTFDGLKATERHLFLNQFDRAFQRGGG